MGFLRRDYGAAGLFQLAHSGQLTGVQAVVALTVMTLFVPCVANFLMMVRERGLKTGLAILGGHHADRRLHGSGTQLCPPCAWHSVLTVVPAAVLARRSARRGVVVDVRAAADGRGRSAAGARRHPGRHRHDAAALSWRRVPVRSNGARGRAGSRGRHSASSVGGPPMTPALRLVFWETTKACNLTCQHCRAVPQRKLGPTRTDHVRCVRSHRRDSGGRQAGVRALGR